MCVFLLQLFFYQCSLIKNKEEVSMTKHEFSTKILDCSYSLWRAVLVGDRNLGYKKAKLVSQVLKTSSDVWMDPEKLSDRKAAWENFNERGKK